MKALSVVALATLFIASSPVSAVSQGDLRMNGFGTVGITHLGGAGDAKGYGVYGQTTDSWRGDQLSKLGAQFQYGLTDTLNLTVQTIAKAEQDEWNLNLEWFYLSYRPNDQLTLRAGRLRPAMFLFSDTIDVGYSYPWLRLPDEAYGLIQLSNLEGAEAIYDFLTSVGTLTIQSSFGQAVNRELYRAGADQRIDVDYKELLTTSIALSTDTFGALRYSYSETNLMMGGRPATKAKFTSVGHRFDNGTWLTNTEMVQRRVDGIPTSDAFYLQAGRRFDELLTHVTYAQLDEADCCRQVSWTYGLNYSLTANVMLKGEFKRVEVSNTGPSTPPGAQGLFVPNYSTVSPTFDGDIVSAGIDFVF